MEELEELQDDLDHYKNMYEIMKRWVTVLAIKYGGEINISSSDIDKGFEYDIEVMENFDNGKTLIARKINR